MGRRKIKQEPPEADPEFQVAPMVDVLLVLLIFFMSITSSEILRNVKGIELPIAKNAAEKNKKSSQVVVNVTWDPGKRKGGLVVEDRDYLDPMEIVPMLKGRFDLNPMTRVLVRGDKNVEYSYVSQVMKACASANISSVTFSVVTGEKK